MGAASSMVLGGAIIQVTIVVGPTWALGRSQRRMSTSTPLRTEHGRHPNPPPLLAWVTLACASCLAVLPLLAVASSSVLIRGRHRLMAGSSYPMESGLARWEVGYAGVSFMPW